MPAPLLKLGLGEMSAELLTSARVLPERLLEAGFEFELPDHRRRAGGGAAPLSQQRQ